MYKLVTTIGLSVLSTLLAATLVTAQSSPDVPKNPSDVGYLNLHKRHPDGYEGREEFDRYAIREALGRLEQMRGFLSSFVRLTNQARLRMDAATLRAIGNTSSEMQTIGFHNIPLTVEATLLKQAYQLAQSRIRARANEVRKKPDNRSRRGTREDRVSGCYRRAAELLGYEAPDGLSTWITNSY